MNVFFNLFYLKKIASRLCRCPGGQKFVEIVLSPTVSEINVFLRFTQKFKMATKNGGKMIFEKSSQLTLQIPWGSKISLKSLYITFQR